MELETTYRLTSWQKTYESTDKRFWHSLDLSGKYVVVEVTRKLEVSCRCKTHGERLHNPEAPICEHVQDALEFVENVGWAKLPTWRKDGKTPLAVAS